jgi:hypothetical protein
LMKMERNERKGQLLLICMEGNMFVNVYNEIYVLDL